MVTNFSKELVLSRGTKSVCGSLILTTRLAGTRGTRRRRAWRRRSTRLNKLQYLLYAEAKHALLVVLQGLDAAGKDGTIRHVMSGINPQGCRVASFKTPSPEEARTISVARAPGRATDGDIGIFNRSHYEDVLIVRVHNLVPKEVWSKRYEQINSFEASWTENNVTHPEILLAHQQGRAEEALHGADRRSRQALEDFAGGFRRAQILGRIHDRLMKMHWSAAARRRRLGS